LKSSREDNFNRASDDLSNYQLVKVGDLVINKMKAWQGSLSITALEGIVSPAYFVLEPLHSHFEARFFQYLLKSGPMVADYAKVSSGVRTGQWDLDPSAFTRLKVRMPPVEIQKAIADYLDRETARIDTLIEKQERLIETLRERRSATYDNSFREATRSRRTTVRRVLKKLRRPTTPGLGVVTAYRDGTVTLRANRRQDGYTFSEIEVGYQGVVSGDVVFHALDGFAGAVGVSDSNGNATPVYHVCQPSEGDSPEYLASLLRYLGTSGFLETRAPNVRQRSVDFRNWSTFASVPISLPDRKQQDDIMKEIRHRISAIDKLVAKTQEFITLTKERRSALITAAVTGQIEVEEMTDG
jgi:type I restriction enzyme S subunit